MPKRKLHIAAYDVTQPERLRRMLNVVKDYATGGQKSAYECYLTASEVSQVLQRVKSTLNLEKDRFACLELKQGKAVHVLGKAVTPQDKGYFYID